MSLIHELEALQAERGHLDDESLRQLARRVGEPLLPLPVPSPLSFFLPFFLPFFPSCYHPQSSFSLSIT